ncbi:MAG: hypothetical protein GWP25_03705 [Euryarchaeota archaeon]|nr:hypothetical protein [Euryarchaeota archaeon]
MDGGRDGYTFSSSVAMALLFTVIMLSPLATSSAEDSPSSTTLIDGRIAGFQAEPSVDYTRDWMVEEGEWLSLNLDCNQCQAQLTLDGNTTTSSSGITLQAESNGAVQLVISSTIQEYVSFSLVENIHEDFSHLRPSPTENITFVTSKYCNDVLTCINPTQGNLDGIPHGEYNSSDYIRGILELSTPEYIPLEVAAGDTLELQFVHTTDEISLSVYFQNTTSEHLHEQTLEQSLGLVANVAGDAKLWHFSEDGRVLVKVESGGVDTAWVLKKMMYENHYSNTLIESHDNLKLVGHSSTSATIEMNDTQKFTLEAFHTSPRLQIDQLVSGTWINGQFQNMTAEQATVFYPYPNISAVRIHADSPVHWIEIEVSDISDLHSGEEAPSYRPSTAASVNTSWPLMPMQSAPLQAELTLSIHDTADVYRFEIEGWDESEHLVQILVEGSNIESLQLELWSLDQESWEVVESKQAMFSNGKIQLAVEVSRGTHFFRVSLLDSVNHTQHSWGEEVPSISYFLSSGYTLIDEGDEPYFPPDENAEKWGVRARFFLGALFLIPVAFLVIQQYRTKRTAQQLLLKSEQLVWFKSQMDSGKFTPQQSRKSLANALQAITLLNWEEANKAWGKTDLEYRTENIALAVWKLDRRMAGHEGAVPLMVGVHIVEGNWDLAALRFDAPVGQAWKVERVEPRFLHRGEEVFLDTMAKGNRTFIMAELSGGATSVDIELNGRLEGEPSAARIPSTLMLESANEEE